MKAKVLIYDIETAPNLSFVWGQYEQNVIDHKREWYMLCFAYKWLDEKKTHVIGLDDFKRFKKDKTNDYDVVKALYDLFDEADIIVAHNGNSFDQKKTHSRFLFHGFSPPSPYKQIDTKLVARRYFRFNSNKLDHLGKHFGLGQKIETGGFELWTGCMEGDPKAWAKMKKYNKQDVVLLKKVYIKMRPWITGHPYISSMEGRPDTCDHCGSDKMHQHTKKTYAKQGWKYQYKCYNCGAYKMGAKLHKFKNYLT